MFNCTTHVVECLRNNKIYPKAYSPIGSPNKGLEYTLNSRFDPVSNENNYWYVDLKKKIKIESYQIKTYAECNWVSYWNIYLSNDSITWSESVSSYDGYPYDYIFEINSSRPARYFRIDGNAKRCTGYEKMLAFFWIKIFGSIIIEKDKTCRCIKNARNYMSFSIILLISK